jgi:hypothetical protein
VFEADELITFHHHGVYHTDALRVFVPRDS